MARQFRRSSGRGQRLSRRWLGFTTDGTFFGVGAGNVAINMLAATALKDTVMRTRGQVTAAVDGALATSKAILITVGLWLVPEGTGATVLADPFSDADQDWFYYSQFGLMYEESVVDAIAQPVVSGYREVIDTKAMRIGDSDTEVQLVMNNTTISGAMPVNLIASGRFLLGR